MDNENLKIDLFCNNFSVYKSILSGAKGVDNYVFFPSNCERLKFSPKNI